MKKDKVAEKKSEDIKQLILEALEVLSSAGVKLDDYTKRGLEKIAMCTLALFDLTPGKSWGEAKSFKDGHSLKTRDIIRFINKHFEESISLGSYDDIRRKDLVRPVGMGLVLKSANNPKADTNDGTRGYAIHDDFGELARSFGTPQWEASVNSFEVDYEYLEQLEAKRESTKLQVQVAEGLTIKLDDGPHNKIQKAVIEEFLPIFGHNAKVLYVGDTSNKQMLKFTNEMVKLGLNIEDRGMLPDIIAYSEEKNWLYLIEAVHSSNPLNPERCIELRRTVLNDCKAGIVFVTAFLTRKDFSRWISDIAWETEVWLADKPEHMIHFNGDKFLGPHNSPPYTSK
ncbi:BsuBI/PstI family type II restriction endonuclease [Vibrio sp. Hep-1b-8]|uniref:BsuBI/PstI family type II restriction endonuclease n=1 Tax=Vibrio sp. Hep-1b-8 TaxID=2144187 RepID=UPI0011108D44|nr:BsuBI/PstI family type II restriction endonuclease [Vibrio sp. Hep-1b-8]TMX35280.1 restriction endonuclease [Vibrio sp. Hep-1b-8]